MAILKTIRITGLEDVRRVVAAGLAALGHASIDASSIRFDAESVTADFVVEPPAERKPLVDFQKAMQISGRASEERA